MQVHIETKGEAFKDPKTGLYNERFEGYEICRILREVIKQIEDGNCAGTLYDMNRKRVGNWMR